MTRIKLLVFFIVLATMLSNLIFGKPVFVESVVFAQNSNTECPPNSSNIWVRLDRYGDGTYSWINIPFDSGYDDTDIDGPGPDAATGYINYLAGVLITEVGTTNKPINEGVTVFDNNVLKAMSILARSVAYNNCGDYDVAGHDGIDDTKQGYDPIKATTYSDSQRYMDAVSATDAIYITYNDSVFDVQYRNISKNPTNGTLMPHKSVYDPAGDHHSDQPSQTGFQQINANHYATGQNHSETLPAWKYLQLIVHYLSNIKFRNIANTSNDYRFNVLEMDNFSDGYIFYDANRRKNDITIIVQNTGTKTLIPGTEGDFSCKPASYNMALSYHIYNEQTGQIACGNPNIPGGNPCFEGVRNYMCVPFAGGQTPPGGSFVIQGVTIDLPQELAVDNCYILRWDIVLYNNHDEVTWISRLQQNPALAQWPTQDVRFCYLPQSGSNDPDPPQNPTATSGHTANTWSNKPNITIAWSPPGGLVSGYEYRHQGAGSDISSGWHSTGNTWKSFFATEDGSHSLKVRSVLAGNKSDSIIAGPYLIDRRSPALSINQPTLNWVTTNRITLNWIGVDTGLSGQMSGLSHYDVYSAANPGGPWTPLALNTTQETISITGSNDQYYHFKVIAYDQAGNSAEQRKTVQVRTFPYLSVTPNPLKWTVTLSNTAPSARTLQILNNGGKIMTWTVQTDFPYLTLPTANGLDDTTLPITLTHPLTYGTFSGMLTVTGTADTRDSPVVISATIQVVDQFRYYLPLIFKQ